MRELVQEPEERDVLRHPDLDRHVLRDERHQPLELAREDRGSRVRRGRVVRVPAAGVGHRGEQVLVEVLAEPDRRRADVRRLGPLARHPHERAGVGDADVRQAVGEQQDLPRALAGRAPELLDALQPPAGQVRLAARVDRADPRQERRLVDGREGSEQVHVLVVGDQGELVGRREPPDQERGALAGDLELGSGHRARPVDDEREMQRRAGTAFGSRWSLELEHAVDGVLGLDGEQLVLEADVRLHEGGLLRG